MTTDVLVSYRKLGPYILQFLLIHVLLYRSKSYGWQIPLRKWNNMLALGTKQGTREVCGPRFLFVCFCVFGALSTMSVLNPSK